MNNLHKLLLGALLALMAVSANARAKWETYYLDSIPMRTELVVERAGQLARYHVNYTYNYTDSTFRIRVYPTAGMLMYMQERLHRSPRRPAYIEHTFRFTGGQNGKQKVVYRTYDTDPDIDKIVAQGYFEDVVKDDGRILQNLRDCKTMQIRFWSVTDGAYNTLHIDAREFEKNRVDLPFSTDMPSVH